MFTINKQKVGESTYRLIIITLSYLSNFSIIVGDFRRGGFMLTVLVGLTL
jgi:hypothetical protein